MSKAEDRALQQKAKSFLKELDLLTEKYGLVIGGCESCCGAPWVTTSGKQVNYLVEYLRYCKTCKGYGPAAAHEDC